MFSWCSRKQDNVAQSTAQVEYAAVTAAVNQAIWIRKILVDLHMNQLELTKIYVDNQAAISIANNPVFHGRISILKSSYIFLEKRRKKKKLLCYTAKLMIRLQMF
jgi:hypothetical protein